MLKVALGPSLFVSLGICDPQRSDFKFQTALLTVVIVISQGGIAVFCRGPIECFW